MRARIRELEAENASLAAAAEEAATLAEAYAQDAARWRAASNGCDEGAGLVEIADAARRKERRIERLTAQLAEERDTSRRLVSRVAELEELKVLAEEMEETLQQSLAAVQDAHGEQRYSRDADGAEGVVLAKQYLDAISSFLPPEIAVEGDIDALHLSLLMKSVVGCHGRCVDLLQGTVPALAAALEAAESALHRATMWCFEDSAQIPIRAAAMRPAAASLEERTRALVADIQSVENAQSWNAEYVQMKVGLLTMAVDSVLALVPESFRIPTSTALDLRVALEPRVKDIRERLAGLATSSAHASNLARESASRADVASTLLQQRERELEDVRVRAGVFEDRLAAATVAVTKGEELKAQIAHLENQLELAQQAQDEQVLAAVVQVQRDADRIAEPSVDSEQEMRTNEHGGDSQRLVEFRLGLALDESRRSANRLRRQLTERRLADLVASQEVSTERVERMQKRRVARDAMSKALSLAKSSAASAHVVRLDPETLEPQTRGATMSSKGLLQSLALAQNHIGSEALLAQHGLFPLATTALDVPNASQNAASLAALHKVIVSGVM